MEEQIAGLREHMAATSELASEALRELRALREDHRKEMQALTDKHNALDRAFAEARGTVRGVKIGWAAAFAARLTHDVSPRSRPTPYTMLGRSPSDGTPKSRA